VSSLGSSPILIKILFAFSSNKFSLQKPQAFTKKKIKTFEEVLRDAETKIIAQETPQKIAGCIAT
jgi:hypothetical protein